jgi:hypothetical protein
MTTTVQRLRIQDFEAEAGWVDHPGPEAERALDNEWVALLLSGDSERARPHQDREPEVVIEPADDRDALAGMRGVMVGLALMLPFWALVAAIVLLN